jgi:hypothetical protein
MRDNYYIIGAGYCSLQFLLRYQNPIAYSAGVYGWSCDYYNVDDVIISTGYGYINSKNTFANYEMIKKYDDKARHILDNNTHEIAKKKINKLLHSFIRKSKEDKR